jgi:hypothetical protein
MSRTKSTLTTVDSVFKEYSYLIYLCSLLFWIGFLPLFEITGFESIVEFAFSNLIVVSSFYFLYSDGNKMLAYVLIPFVLVLGWLDFFLKSHHGLDLWSHISWVILFSVITFHFLRRIFKSTIINVQTIYIAIAGYVMIALMASILCWVVNYFYPGAYNFNPDPDGPIYDFAYYVIVTMSTLGYGDILPIAPQSKALAILIVLIGQFYMTILMALLIGKFLSQNSKKD